MVDPLIPGSTRFGLHAYDRGVEEDLKVDNNEAKSVTSPAVSHSTVLNFGFPDDESIRNELISVDWHLGAESST